MPETPPLLEDGTDGKKPKLLPDGRMPLRKKALIAGGVALMVVIIGVTVYLVAHTSQPSNDNTSPANSLSGDNLTATDSSTNSTPISQIDDSSLAQDLTAIDTGVKTGDDTNTAADTALNDKSKEITVQTDASSATENASNRLTRIKQRGDSEIARRVNALNLAFTAVSGATNLSTAARDTLHNEVSSEVAGLSALRIKLQGETTVAGAAADISSMVTEYRVYALLIPKARLVRAADNQIVVEQKLADMQTKLAERISQAAVKGKDVSALQTTLSELESHITAAQALSNDAEAPLLLLQPTDYNNDHSILSAYRDKLKTAHSHNKTSLSLAKEIIKGLKNVN